MGRGDRKTRKGKISIRSYGNVRPHAEKTGETATRPASPRKSASASASKPAAKKTTARKTAAKKSA